MPVLQARLYHHDIPLSVFPNISGFQSSVNSQDRLDAHVVLFYAILFSLFPELRMILLTPLLNVVLKIDTKCGIVHHGKTSARYVSYRNEAARWYLRMQIHVISGDILHLSETIKAGVKYFIPTQGAQVGGE